MDNKRIKVTELDFDQIKSNLKSFLQSQSQFTDYDFEGSSLSILLDVLAYNTHYNAMYAHLALNESFLDSAAKRNSVVSHAKSLGYLPYSAKSARAYVNITVTSPNGLPNTLTLPAYSQFDTQIDGVNYTFFNRSAATTSKNLTTNSYFFQSVEITEGTYLRNRYEANEGVKYIIPNPGADLSTLQVTVQETSNSTTYYTYTHATNLTTVKSTDTVYFVSEIDDGLYEVYFGDGVLGKALMAGNIVTLSYMVSNASAPNKASDFIFNGTIGGGTVIVSSASAAAGGSESESIDSIKLNAPRSFSAQNRAVTAEDYKTLLPQLYPNIESLNVWGGEENDPPQYGKVYISIKPESGETLTVTAKEYIKNQLLKNKNVVGIQPVLVDPEYLYISIQTNVYYNPLKTNKAPDTLKALVLDSILNYDNNELRQFGGLFRFSKLGRLIDLSDESITSNITNIRMAKTFYPSFSTPLQYTINYGNPIYSEGVAEESVRSSGFYVYGVDQMVYMDDDGLGNLRLFYLTGVGEKVIVTSITKVGTIDYTTGTIIISDQVPFLSSIDNSVTIYCVPDSNDVLSLRNQLVRIKQTSISVDIIVDKVASGQFTGGTNYIFSSSHNYTA